MKIRTNDFKYLGNDGEITLFNRDENEIECVYLDDENFSIYSVAKNLILHYDIKDYDELQYYRVNFVSTENLEETQLTFTLKKGKLKTKIEGNEFYLTINEYDEFIFSQENYTYMSITNDDLNINFFPDDYLKMSNVILERKNIPKTNIYIKDHSLMTSMKRGSEYLFYKHIICNNKENIIPKIYKTSFNITIMKLYDCTLGQIKFIDDYTYEIKIKKQKYLFKFNSEKTVKQHIYDKLKYTIQEMAKLGIWHSDLSFDNFVTTMDLSEIKIIDFGMSSFINTKKDLHQMSTYYDDYNIENINDLTNSQIENWLDGIWDL